MKNCVQLKAKIVCELLENVFSLNRRLFSKIHVRFLRKFHNLFHEFEKKSIAQETELGIWRYNLVFFSVNFERRKKKMCRWNLLRIKENENGSLTRYLLSPKTTTFCNLKKPWIFLYSKNFMNFKRIVDKCTVEALPKNEHILYY